MDQPWRDLEEVNYDAGRPFSSYRSFLDLHTGPNAAHVPVFPTIKGIINGTTIDLLAINYVFRVERHFQLAKNFHSQAHREDPVLFAIERMKEEIEIVVYCMRKSIDHFIQGSVLKFETD